MEEIPQRILQKILRGFLLIFPLGILGIVLLHFHTPKTPLFSFPIQTPGESPPYGDGTHIEIVSPYQIKALVLEAKTYSDQNSDIVPVDLALGWNSLTDPKLARLLQLHQSHRFYYWTLPPNTPLSTGEVIANSANTHMVANSPEMKATLLQLKRGDLIFIEGNLVNIHRPNGVWKTSTSRTDTGPGACEIFLPNSLTVLQRDLL